MTASKVWPQHFVSCGLQKKVAVHVFTECDELLARLFYHSHCEGHVLRLDVDVSLCWSQNVQFDVRSQNVAVSSGCSFMFPVVAFVLFSCKCIWNLVFFLDACIFRSPKVRNAIAYVFCSFQKRAMSLLQKADSFCSLQVLSSASLLVIAWRLRRRGCNLHGFTWSLTRHSSSRRSLLDF